jgi:hypothetical protein
MITTSLPLSRWTAISGLAARFSTASEPVEKNSVPSSQTPQTGRQCGRPSGRVVAIQ